MKTTILSWGSVGLVVLSISACITKPQKAEVFGATQHQLAEGVGDPCALGLERSPSYAGLEGDETVVETGTDCQTGICVAYHFRGRVDCPNGNDPTSSSGPTCTTSSGDPVTVAVPPQLSNRPASDAVICSCRCDGPPEAAPFCACPDGFSCENLRDLPLRFTQGQGSYCLKQ